MKNFSFPKGNATAMLHTLALFFYKKTFLLLFSLFFLNSLYAIENQDTIPPDILITNSFGEEITAVDTLFLEEGECTVSLSFFLLVTDDCDGLITGDTAVWAAIEDAPWTNPASTVFVSLQNNGFYLVTGNFYKGNTTLTLHATDAAGNVSTISFVVIIRSSVIPEITYEIEDPILLSSCSTVRTILVHYKVCGVCEYEDNYTSFYTTINGTEVLLDQGYDMGCYNLTYSVAVTLFDDNLVCSAGYNDWGAFSLLDYTLHIEQVPEGTPPIITALDDYVAIPYCEDDIVYCYNFQICDLCEDINPDNVFLDANGTEWSVSSQDVNEQTNCGFFEACGTISSGNHTFTITYEGEELQSEAIIEQLSNQAAVVEIVNDLNYLIPNCNAEITSTLAVQVTDDCGVINIDSLIVCVGTATWNHADAYVSEGYFEFLVTLDIEDDGDVVKIIYTDEEGLVTTVYDTIHVSTFPDTWAPVLVYPSEDIIIDIASCESSTTVAFFDIYAVDNCEGDVPVYLQLFTSDGVEITAATFLDIGGTTMGVTLSANEDYVVKASAIDAFGNISAGEFHIITHQAMSPDANLVCNEELTITLVDSNSILLTPAMLLSGEWGCLTENDFSITMLDGNSEYLMGCDTFMYEIHQLGTENTIGFTQSFSPNLWRVLDNIEDNAVVTFTDTSMLLETLASGEFDSDAFQLEEIDVMAMLPIIEDGTLSFDYDFNGYGDRWGWFILSDNGSVTEQYSSSVGVGSENQLLSAGDVILFTIDDDGLHPIGPNLPSVLLINNLSFSPAVNTNTELFCTGIVTTEGNVAPTLTCPSDTLVYSTGPFDCVANFPIPYPIVTDSCASYELFADVYELIYIPPIDFVEFGHWEQGVVYEGLPGDYVVGISRNALFIRYYAIVGSDTSFVDCPLVIEDQRQPVAVCVDDISFSIGNNGVSRIYADEIDEGSNDNCTQNVRLEVQYNDSDWGEYAEIGCEYINEYITVTLRVWDDANNDGIVGNEGDLSNSCSVEILVEDNISPSCVAPLDTTIRCTDVQILAIDWEDEEMINALFGEAFATDNCSATTDQTTIEINLNDCGWGTITRTFVATDIAGNTSITPCQQVITIYEMHDYEIKFPKDNLDITCGEAIIDTLTYFSVGCDLFTVNIYDERYPSLGLECYYILRTFRLINWCEWDGETDSIVISRDEDCDSNPGDDNIWVLVRTESEGENPTYTTYLDRNNDENSNPYLGNNRCATGTGVLPSGHWANSNNNPEITSVGHWQYTQLIKIFDEEIPQAEIMEYDIFCSTNSNCTGEVAITFVVTETCGINKVVTEGIVDLDSDGVNDGEIIIGMGPVYGNTKTFTITGNYPIGAHVFILTIEDDCHNEMELELPFEVIDCAPPIFECITGETITLEWQPDGCCSKTVSAIDFVETANTDCSIPFVFSIHKAIEVENGSDIPQASQTEITVDCNDGGTLLALIYAWDDAYNPYAVQPDGSAGGPNYAYCETYLLLQNDIDCPLIEPPLYGVIFTEDNVAIEGVEVDLTGHVMQSRLTSHTGDYQFYGSNIESGFDYTITPHSNTLPPNAITTFDLILITKHILGIQLLDSPYKIIAADINASGSVTNLDVIQLRNLLLGLSDEFPNNTFWRFVDAAYVFPDPTNPWAAVFSEVINIAATDMFSLDYNFVGVVIGDVNGSAVTNFVDDVAEREETDAFILTTPAIRLKKGEHYQISFTANDFSAIMGYQFTLGFDPTVLDFIAIEDGIAKAENFGLNYIEEGLITTSWYTFDGNQKVNETLFTLRFTAKTDANLSEIMTLNSRITKAEAYDDSGVLAVKLNFTATAKETTIFELYQNTPNPFSHATNIGFTLPNEDAVSIAIHDITGKRLQNLTLEGKKGYNSIHINAENLTVTGVLFYTISTGTYTATKRMVIVK